MRKKHHTCSDITIDPAPQAAFVNPPTDITLTCDAAQNFVVTTLDYTNNETGSCEISGSVPGTLAGTFDECGGSQTITWTFTDDCGRNITHVQTITIDPAPQAAFVNPPTDITLTCDAAQNFVVNTLAYTNNETGSCEISGSVPGTLAGTFDECGGSQTITWTFTDDCGRNITHVQTITIDPAPQAAFVNPPTDITFTCDAAQNFVVNTLAYTNNETGSCEISGSVPGTLAGTFDECGGSQTITWTFTDDCGRNITHVQKITIDPAPQAAFVNPPTDITITCDAAQNFVVTTLAYTNNETGSCEISGSVPGTLAGTFDECGGSQTITWTFTDDCGRNITHVQTITIDPAPQAAFVNPPTDITLTCDAAQNFVVTTLAYTNNETGSCEISGSVPGTLAGTFDECGGSQTITWTFTDDCGRNITHVQTITIDPAPQAAFVNPPADVTLTCDDAQNFVVNTLAYTNNETGSCEISGSVPGTLAGTFDECGGSQTITWTFTDDCGRNITHVQTITIDPAPQAAFVNPPTDITLTCDAAQNFVVTTLAYTNNETGSCEISGSVPGTLAGTFDECGGSQTITWTFTDDCGRVITHTQNITIDPAPQAAFVNPPTDITLTCDAAQNFVVNTLAYTNNETGSCEISGSVPGTLAGTFDECGGSQTITWTFTDDCGRNITHVQTITIDPAPQAAFVNPPTDITLTCDAAQNFVVTTLAYTNNETGSCEISGSVPGTLAGTFDECGGSQTITWTFTDDCGRNITHVQTITIDPAPQAAFVNPPTDITLTCDAAQNFVVTTLAYTNNETGSCEISGSVPGTLAGTFDECGGSQTITWTFTDDCGRNITHVQTITIDP
ncbi:MAG: hypothetical protein IPI60_20230, partial [Saprospiraceae bacterium]|nr:hypothetical protein [Saprospiraceae bacterium]